MGGGGSGWGTEGVVEVGTVAAGALGGALGAGGGAVARVLLARLRRGARVRAPVCEVAVAVAWAGVGAGWAAGVWTGPWAVLLLALSWFAVVVGLADLRHRRLPDALTLPAVPAALLLVAPLGAVALGRAAAGAALACGVHAAVHLASPRSLGAGDVKLAASLGAVLAAVSWAALPSAAVLASLLTVVAVVSRAVVSRAVPSRAVPSPAVPSPAALSPAVEPVGVPVTDPPPVRLRAPVPHGPSMLLATLVVVAAGALRW